jgi:tRNA pseudouridine55 synthase
MCSAKSIKSKPPASPPPQNKMKGILLIDKPRGRSSFSLVPFLRKRLQVQKIGHAGTLDPFATGVMVMLIGKEFTRLATQFLQHDKEYLATLHLGITTDSYDCDGALISQNQHIPTLSEVEAAIAHFQGTMNQVPPMFSAKKQNGKRLYELARKGIEVERPPVEVTMATTLRSYNYPYLEIHVTCSKGTYIRSIAHEMGQRLGCGAHLSTLVRQRSGPFHLSHCSSVEQLAQPEFDLKNLLIHAHST